MSIFPRTLIWKKIYFNTFTFKVVIDALTDIFHNSITSNLGDGTKESDWRCYFIVGCLITSSSFVCKHYSVAPLWFLDWWGWNDSLMMRTDATSPLGYAPNASVSGFKGWGSQRRQLSSNIKLKRKNRTGTQANVCWCVKANLPPEVSSKTRDSTCWGRVNSVTGRQKRKKNSSCNLLLLNRHQEEFVVFCHITLNKLCKRLEHFLPSKRLHLCAACFSKGLISNGTISLLWIILQIFHQERTLINETGQRSTQNERALRRWDRRKASHTHQPAPIDLYKKSMLELGPVSWNLQKKKTIPLKQPLPGYKPAAAATVLTWVQRRPYLKVQWQ